MEDLIRRQEAIEKLCKRCQISNDGMCKEGDCIDLKLIRLVPSAEAIPVEWIEKWMGYQCSWDTQGVKSLLRDWAKRKEE